MALQGIVPGALPGPIAAKLVETAAELVRQDVPESLAQRLAALPVLAYASDIVLVSERAGVSVGDGAQAFFGVLGAFELWPVFEQGHAIVLADRFERMALDRALANLLRAQRDLTADVLAAGTGSVAERLAAWRSLHQANVTRTAQAVAELTQGHLTVSRLSVAAGLLTDLAL